jgi:hypothetical protein
MFGRNRERVFYIEGKFLFDDLKWFLGYYTLDDSMKESIYVLLSSIMPYLFLIILCDGERGDECRSFVGLWYFIVPSPSLGSYFLFSHREVFLCYCFIVSEGRQLMGKELSPFSC